MAQAIPSFRSLERVEFFMSADGREFLSTSDTGTMQQILDTVFVEPDLYRFRLHRAYKKNEMDLLRYLTSPRALEARDCERLNKADIVELLNMEDPTITQNLLTSVKTRAFAQEIMGILHPPEGSEEKKAPA